MRWYFIQEPGNEITLKEKKIRWTAQILSSYRPPFPIPAIHIILLHSLFDDWSKQSHSGLHLFTNASEKRSCNPGTPLSSSSSWTSLLTVGGRQVDMKVSGRWLRSRLWSQYSTCNKQDHDLMAAVTFFNLKDMIPTQRKVDKYPVANSGYDWSDRR